MRGKLITIYGINNLGKTTQARLLVDRLTQEGKQVHYLKYPLYTFSPSGPAINAYLRNGNPHALSAREAQLIYILNRTQYDTALRARIDSGEWIVAEDYVGTGIAWGIGAGVDASFLHELNSHLLTEDLALFMDGKRFLDGKEEGHKHESDDALMEKVATIHHTLAQKLGWFMVNANESREEVADAVWKHVKRLLE
jgi:dTMP kinase